MHPTSQALRRPLIIISALIASIGAFTIGASVASAHHSNIVAADVNCSGAVTFTTSAWEGQGEGEEFTNSRTNPSVDVTYRINDAGADIFVANGAFSEANGFQFQGSFIWPASNPESITIYSTPQAPWANNSPGGGFASATITRPTGCANPSASLTVQCAASGGTVVVTLVNGDIFWPMDFSVGNPVTGTVQVVTVAADSTSTVTFTGIPDGSYTVPVLAGSDDLSQDFVVACDETPTTTTSGPTTTVASAGPVPTTTTVASAGPVPTTTTAVVASLPATGSSTMTGVLIGTALVALGGMAAFAARRRRPA